MNISTKYSIAHASGPISRLDKASAATGHGSPDSEKGEKASKIFK